MGKAGNIVQEVLASGVCRKQLTEKSSVKLLVRMSTHAEELVRVAGERGLDLLVLVSRPRTQLGIKQEIRAHTARVKQSF